LVYYKEIPAWQIWYLQYTTDTQIGGIMELALFSIAFFVTLLSRTVEIRNNKMDDVNDLFLW